MQRQLRFTHRFRLYLLLAGAFFFGGSAAATAKSSASEPAVDLGPMVVTAAGVETSMLTSPASVTVITGEELERSSFVDLTDALRNVPGVSVAGPADGENIFIRGLPSEYTLILVDGKRLNSRASRSNASGGVVERHRNLSLRRHPDLRTSG